jgi:hypothetical protein
MADTIVAPPRPRPGQLPAGSGPRRRYGAPRLDSNAPFAAEVQSNIEQSCCSVTPMSAFAGKADVV